MKELSMIKNIAAILMCLVMIVASGMSVYAETLPEISVSSSEGMPGDTIEIEVSFQNNPGITAAKLIVTYGEGISAKRVTFNRAEFGGMTMTSPSMDSPLILSWVNGLENNYTDGTFATITFQVNDGALAGKIPVEISYDEDDIFDLTEKNILFQIQQGGITVKSSGGNEPLGDVNTEKSPGTVKEELSVGETTVLPQTTEEKESWISSDDSVLKVEAGVVTAVGSGTALIMRVAEDDSILEAWQIEVPENQESASVLDQPTQKEAEESLPEATAQEGANTDAKSEPTGAFPLAAAFVAIIAVVIFVFVKIANRNKGKRLKQ